ncbi:MAG: hypothetical protein IJ763_01615 [Lachnospiraceae bacterium]|nr:hypothetical protein [Lachnospiraceae bacterium]
MNCSVCGSLVPDGSAVCPNCGANLIQYQQPVNPQGAQQPYGQPQQGAFTPQGMQQPYGQPQQQGGFVPQGMPQQPYGQPQQQGGFVPQGMPQQPYGQQMGGYNQSFGNMGGASNDIVNLIKSDLFRIAGLVGGLLLFLNPFFPWLKVKVWGESESDFLFQMGAMNVICGLLLMLLGAFVIAWNIAEAIPALNNIKQNLNNSTNGLIEIIVPAVALVLVILLWIVSFAWGSEEGTKLKDAIDLVEAFGGKASHGAGPLFGIIGSLCAAVPGIIKMTKKN